MVFEKVGDSYKTAVSESCDYNHALIVGDKIWLFGKKFVSQPTFDWGHHVAFPGTYVVAFNTSSNKWEDSHTFSALTNEENVDEAMFIFDGAIHALLYTSFGEVSVKSLHKWTGSSFESVNLKGFTPIPASDPKSRVTMVVAQGLDDKTKYLISTVDHQMRVARITSTGDGATAEHLFDISCGDQILSNGQALGFKLAQATSAAAVDGRLLVCFGVHGCGFRWEKGRVIVCDIENKSSQCLEITSDPSPHWGFSGAHAYGLTSSGSWIHAAGMVPRGMSGGSFDGSIWQLNDLTSTPTWKKLENEIPSDMEGEVVIDSKNGVVYSIGKTQIGKATLQ